MSTTERLRTASQKHRKRRSKRACHPQKRRFGEILEELRALTLEGEWFTPKDYAEALADYLGISIYLIYPDDRDAPWYEALRTRYGSAAGLRFVPEDQLAIVEVPESFRGVARLILIYHELAHLAAGHPMPDHKLVYTEDCPLGKTEELDAPRTSLDRLALRVPPRPELHELDAELRARDVLRASLFGPKIYDRPEYLLALSDHRFPTPEYSPAMLRELFR